MRKKCDSMGSPTFVCQFSDGVVTQMTTHCADGLDLKRGIALAQAAYRSRIKGNKPPSIAEASFQTKDGVVLCEYDSKAITEAGRHDRGIEGDILETMKTELDECVELLRPHYPDLDDESLCERARCLRPHRYQDGRWPTDEEIRHPELVLTNERLRECLRTWAALKATEDQAETTEDQAA